MRKRAFNVMNFLALNVLFFALYLNFIHKDRNTLPAVSASSHISAKSLAGKDANSKVPSAASQKEKTASN
jgi:hypothetical protein